MVENTLSTRREGHGNRPTGKAHHDNGNMLGSLLAGNEEILVLAHTHTYVLAVWYISGEADRWL